MFNPEEALAKKKNNIKLIIEKMRS